MSNVILYESTATDFFNQGLGPLTEAKDPKVTEVGNGEFYLELDYPTTGRLFNQLKNGNLIKSDAGHELKAQRFEIKRVIKSMKQGYVSVYAEHISNQALDIALPANVTLSGSAQNALQQAQSNGLGTFKPFTMSSDITTTNQTKLSIREFKNLKQALGGVEGSILDIWGGEYKFDNYHISLFKKRGRQANAMIAYGRNLVDLEQEENIMNTFTSVYPYAVWRDDEGVEHIIEGSVIHSEHADKYPHHKVLPVDFTLEAEDDTKPTATKLNQLATAYIENNDIGIPEVSIRLTHLDLSKTLDYKEYAEVEKLNVFDEVKIYFADFDINTTAKIVRTVWNVNLRRYDEIEVGKVRASLSDRINTIGKQISEARKEAQDARNVSMVAANGVNMVFFGPDEPTATKVGDRWFMEDGQYTISKVWDGVIWRVVSDPRLSDQNAQLIGEQQAALEEVKTTADYSYDQLQQTIANSGFTDLDAAFNSVQTLSEQAQTNAESAMQKALDNASLIGGLNDSISTMSVAIDDINNSLTLKANTTDIDRIDGTITDINNELTFQSGELSSKVSQTVYDADIGRIETTQTQLTQTFNNFETSVTGSDGRLTLAEQFLDGFRNTAFDPSTGQLSLTEQTIAGLQSTVSDPVNGLETRVTQLSSAYDVTVSKIATWTETYFVNTENPLPLKDINGNNLTPNKSYDVILGVWGTGTVTYFSASLLSNNSSWTLEIHEQNGNSSNHPYIFLNENGYPMVSLYDHTSYYNVRATITEMGSRSKSSISAMYDQINLRVQEGDVYSQLLIDSRNILFDANDRFMISANKVVIDASEGTFISGAVIEDASIDTAQIADAAITSAKILNLDVDQLVGNTANFVTSIWNSVNDSISITSSALESVSNGGNQRITLADASFYSSNRYVEQVNGTWVTDESYLQSGSLYLNKGDTNTRAFIDGSGVVFSDLTTGAYLGGIRREQFDDGARGLTVGSDGIRMVQNRIETPRDSNRHLYIVPTGTGRVRVMSVTGQFYPVQADQFIAGENLNNRLRKVGSNLYLEASTELRLYSYVDQLAFQIGNNIVAHKSLNMNGYSITNQSDRRFKKNIEDSNVIELDLYRKLKFVTYEYTHEDMAKGSHFGLIAQDAGHLGFYNESIDKWQINSSEQIMHNTKAIQEVVNLYDELAMDIEMDRLNQTMIDDEQDRRIEELERIIEEQAGELKQLKGAA